MHCGQPTIALAQLLHVGCRRPIGPSDAPYVCDGPQQRKYRLCVACWVVGPALGRHSPPPSLPVRTRER